MKQQLSEQERHDLMTYRLQRAHETMAEIPNHLLCGYYATAVNRLYYACYYAAVALLIKFNVQPQTHSGVKTMLGLHFVSKGKLAREHGQTFATLFDKRHSGDYDDFAYCDREMVEELYPKAQTFILAVEQLMNDQDPSLK